MIWLITPKTISPNGSSYASQVCSSGLAVQVTVTDLASKITGALHYPPERLLHMHPLRSSAACTRAAFSFGWSFSPKHHSRIGVAIEDVYFCSPVRSRILWSLLSSNRSKLSNPTALGFPMGNTCAAYWMPPIAVIAPTMIANGGSDSKGMCVLCSEVCVFRERCCSKKLVKKRREKEKRGTLGVFFSECVMLISSNQLITKNKKNTKKNAPQH